MQVTDADPAPALSLGGLSLHDVDAIRKILYGGSVVDWPRLNLTERPAVLDLLRTIGFEPDLRTDRKRLHSIQRKAVSYLAEVFGFDFPQDLQQPELVSNVFLAASEQPGERQRLACATLKVMHIVHHLDARELKYRLAISDRALFEEVEDRLVGLLAELRTYGLRVLDFSPSVKQKDAVVTKLLSKRTALAARIYDRLRFRVVVAEPEDVLIVLRHMTHHLFPFNYVVPDESRNDVVDVSTLTQPVFIGPTNEPAAPAVPDVAPIERNEYSGTRYRMISFVADVPVRAEAFIGRPDPLFARLGPVVYVMVEFQLFDSATWNTNEAGDSSHESYKQRQMDGVLRRLTRS